MKKKKIALALTILFVAVMIFSHAFVIVEAHHDCSGSGCPFCEVITVAQTAIRGFTLLTTIVLVFAAFSVARRVLATSKTEEGRSFSLISLKVKLSN